MSGNLEDDTSLDAGGGDPQHPEGHDPSGTPDGASRAGDAAKTASGGTEQGAKPGDVGNLDGKSVDEAFDAFLDQENPGADEGPQTQPTDAKPDGEPQASEIEPDGDGAQPPETPKADDKDSEPTPDELKRGLVPTTKLDRALRTRREAREEAKKLRDEVEKERQLTDRLLDTFDKAGIPTGKLIPFARTVERARGGDQAAAAEVMAMLGLKAGTPAANPATTTAPAGMDQDEAIREALRLAADSLDPDAAFKSLKAKMAAKPPAQPVQTPPTTPERVATPAVDDRVIGSTVRQLKREILTTYGEERAKQVEKMVDTEAHSRLDTLEEIGAVLTPSVIANVYRKAHGTVAARLAQQRKAPPTTRRPSTQAPPTKPMTADEEFAAFQAGLIS
jgi:hypothetical protein